VSSASANEPARLDFISGRDQHPHTLYLQRRLLPARVVGRNGRSQAVVAQHADD
jgi:hypothetical protein